MNKAEMGALGIVIFVFSFILGNFFLSFPFEYLAGVILTTVILLLMSASIIGSMMMMDYLRYCGWGILVSTSFSSVVGFGLVMIIFLAIGGVKCMG